MLKIKYIVLLAIIAVTVFIGIIIVVCQSNKSVSPKEQNQNNTAIEIIDQTKYYPNKLLIYDWRSFQDGKMVYLVCDRDNYIKCQIQQETYPYENSKYSCNFDFGVELRYFDYPQDLVVPFGEDKAVVLWEDRVKRKGSRSSVKISVIHFNDCRQTDSYVLHGSFDIYYHLSETWSIVTYTNSFDIFYKDTEKCGDDECKLTMNDEGKVIEGPVNFVRNDNQNLGDIHSVAKGYVYTKVSDETLGKDLFLLQSNGKEKLLESTEIWFQLSVVQETIGVCSRDSFLHKNITCSQYNSDGELRFNISYKSIVRPYTNTLDIHSHFENIYTLPNEGFLLQFYEFPECPKTSGCKEPFTLGYYVVKLDATGKEVGKFYIKEYDEHFGMYEIRHFWKNQEKEEYCTTLISDGKIDSFNLTATCFTDAIFSA